MVRKNVLEVRIFFPENSIALLTVNGYFPYFQGQKNEIFGTRGGIYECKHVSWNTNNVCHASLQWI